MKRLLPFFLVASALACGVLQPETVEEVATQPAAAQPTQTTAAPTPTPDPLAACPQPGPDQQQVINEAGGYCLLVPAGMTLNANWNSYNTAADVVYTGDVLYPDGPESPSALVEVNVIGAPGIVTELTLSDYINNLAGPMGPFTVEGETTLGGQDAVIVIEPGMFALRGVYTLHNNTLYTLRTLPPDAGEGTPVDTTAIYELASRSFTFFTPQFDDEVRTPRDVCPEPVEGETQVFISRMDGICYLMPADFMPEAAASNWYVGGPDLGDVWPGSPSQVFIAASSQPMQGDSLTEHVQLLNDQILEELTLSGQPAMIIETGPESPIRQQRLVIGYRNTVMAVVVSPWDQTQFPEGIETAQTAWNTMIESVAVFDPWR